MRAIYPEYQVRNATTASCNETFIELLNYKEYMKFFFARNTFIDTIMSISGAVVPIYIHS